ncbi:MAG: hypothetical protein ACOYXC_18295 [Candidatus Rifleibacteriota bacterium]
MRIWALILVLLSCVVGFVLSYGYAYSQISELLFTSAGSVQTTALPANH